jgi:membrane protein YqaA with SNARE-associated domain
LSGLAQLLLAVGVVFAVNLLPAFGPPTWSVLVFFSLNFDLPAVPLVLLGALAAASGRFLLASGARRLRPRFSAARLAHIERIQANAVANRQRAAAGLGLFALSPVPSGQLFVGAGLMTVPLLPLTAAFFSGRLISYSLYVSAASVAEQSLGSIVTDALTSPLGIGLQLAMLAALALLAGGFKPRGDNGRGPAAPSLWDSTDGRSRGRA